MNNLKLRIVSASSKTVACLGASLTSGTVSASYIELLEARLPTWRLTNHGVNGDLAWNALQRLDQLIAEQPEYVTILLGTNDVNATLSERNRFHYLEYQRLPIERPSLAWYESNMEEIVRRLQSETRARIALLSLAPIGEDFSHEANRRMAEYNEVIRRLAERHALAYLPLNEKMWAWLEAHADERAELPPPLAYKDGLTNVGNAIALHASGLSWDEISRRNGLLLMTDCLHLNSRGAGLVADLIAGWLEECAPASGELDRFRPRRNLALRYMIHHLVLLTTKPEVIPSKLEEIMVETRIRLLKISEINNLRVGKRVDVANNPFTYFFSFDVENLDKLSFVHDNAVYTQFEKQILGPFVATSKVLDYEMEPGKDVRYS